MTISVLIQYLDKINKYAKVKKECIDFIKAEILTNENVFKIINDIPNDVYVGYVGYGGYDNNGYRNSLLKALLTIPSKEIIDAVVSKTKHCLWDTLTANPKTKAKEYLNLVKYASNIPPQEMKMILTIFAQSSMFVWLDFESDIPIESDEEVQMLECIE